jgi:hypothetical protein
MFRLQEIYRSLGALLALGAATAVAPVALLLPVGVRAQSAVALSLQRPASQS